MGSAPETDGFETQTPHAESRETDAAAVSRVALAGAQGITGEIRLPESFLLFQAAFGRSGIDLILEPPSGETLIVRDYFANVAPPDLVHGLGGRISGALVGTLAGSPAHFGGETNYSQVAGGNELQPIGTVDSIVGAANAIHDDGSRSQLRVGDPLFPEDVIDIAADATLGIIFADAAILSLGGGSRIVLDSSAYARGGAAAMSLTMMQGVFVFAPSATAGNEPGSMVIDTPVGTIAIENASVGGVVDAHGGSLNVGLLPKADSPGAPPAGTVTVAISGGSTETVNTAGTAISVIDGAITILPLTPLDGSMLFQPAYSETLAESGIDLSFVSFEHFMTAAGSNSGDTGSGDAASPALFVSQPIMPMELVAPATAAKRGPIDVLLNDQSSGLVDHSPQQALGFSDWFGEDFSLPGAPPNQDPTIERIWSTTSEDRPTVPLSPLLLGRDADGGTLTITHIDGRAAPSGAKITLLSGAVVEHTANGMFVYDPNGQFEALSEGFNSRQEATDWFTLTVSDGQGGFATSVAIITILGVNDAPVATPDTAAGAENQVVIFDVLANDTDVDEADDPSTFVLRDVAISRIDGIDIPAVATSKVLVQENAAVFLPGNDFNSLSLGETATVVVDYTMSDALGAQSSSTLTITVHGQNDAPIAKNDDPGATTQNSPLAPIFILANDEDVDRNDTLRIADIDASATRGTVTDLGDGTLAYDPGMAFRHLAAGEIAFDTFKYCIADQHGALSGYASVTITVIGLNDAPVAHRDFASANENVPIRVDVLANDTDIDNGDTPATFRLEAASITAIEGLPAAKAEFPATVSIVGNQIRFEPGTQFRPLGLGEAATVQIAYTMADKAGATSSSTLTLTIHGINDAPYAETDQFETTERSTLRIETSALLANDFDPDINDAIRFASFDSTATKGRVIDNGDGAFSYSPGAAFAFLTEGAFATDTISYRIVDSHGSLSAPATIRIFVRGVNDPPVANDDIAYAVEKGGNVVIDVLANDSDPDSDDNRATLKIVSAVAASGAEVDVTSTPGARIIYKPSTTSAFDGLAKGATGTDTITYTIEDKHGARATAEVVVYLTGINDAPVAVDDTATTGAGAQVLIDVFSGDRDIDGRLDPATITVGRDPQHGVVAVDPISGIVAYTPANGFVGVDSFTYTMRDDHGALSNSATVAVEVKPFSGRPLAVDDAVVADAQRAVRISLLANDFDPGGNGLVIASINGASVAVGSEIILSSGARVRVNEDQTLTYDPGNSFGDLQAGYFAVDRFEYGMADGKGEASEAAAVTVRVVGVAAPELRPGEELVQSFEFPAEGWFADWTRTAKVGPASPDQMPIRVVTQFSIDEQTILPTHPLLSDSGRMALIQAMPYGGDDAVQFNTVAKLEAALHLPGGTVQRDVGVAPHDGSARAIWTDVYLRPGDTLSFDWTFISAESTATRNDFAVMSVSGPGTAQVFKLTSVADVLALSGTASGALGMVTSVFMNPDNAYNEGLFRIGIGVFNRLDNANGSMLLVDDVRINEGGLIADPSNRLMVLAANGSFTSVAERPLALRDAAETLETTPIALPLATLVANDGGPSLGGPIHVAAVSGIATGVGGQTILPSGAVVKVSPSGTVTYDPNGAFRALAHQETATDTFTYTLAAANGATDLGLVAITVIGINDAPIAANDNDVVGLLLANQTAHIQAASLLANDRDPDESDFLTVVAAGPTAHTKGIVTLHADGSVSYDPNGQFDYLGAGEVATDTFAYTISDPHGATATAMVTISITGANDSPVARDDRFWTDEDTILRGNVRIDNGNGPDFDPDATDTLSVSRFDVVSTLGARVVVGADGTFDYDPREAAKIQALGVGEVGEDRFTYTIDDGNGGADSASVWITVHGLNDIPIARNDFFATDENALLSIAKGVFLSNDFDPDANDSLSFATVDSSATRGTVAIRGDTVVYDPRGAFNALRVGETAIDTFKYTVRDSFGAETSASVSITIHGQGTPWTVADFEENIVGHPKPFGWDTAGDVRAVTSYPDPAEPLLKRQPTEPLEGNWMARLDADPWPVADLRAFLGIAGGTNTHLVGDPVDNSMAVDGAAMKQTIMVEAGDLISFRWAFDALDTVEGPFEGANDFALFVANGAAFRIIDVRNQMAMSDMPFGAVTGIAFYQAPTAGQLTIGFGVFDDGSDVDAGLGTDSVLFIDHIQVNREVPTEGYTVVSGLSNDQFQTYAASSAHGA